MTWQPDAERMDREELEQLQLERLEATLLRAYRHVPFYRRQLEGVGFDPDEFRSLDDLRRPPFTTRLARGDDCPPSWNAAVWRLQQRRVHR